MVNFKQNLLIMFSWLQCCEQTVVKNQQVYMLYRGSHSNPKRTPIPNRISQLNQQITSEDSHYRLFITSPYDIFLQDIRLKGQKYTDSQFILSNISNMELRGRKIIWRRMSQLIKGRLCFKEDINKILHLKECDKYFLSALAALAEHPNIIQDVLEQQTEVIETGIYKLNMCVGGRSQQIIIDDYLPVFADNPARTAFTRLIEGMLWVTLFQKGYAKINKGYENIINGYAHEVFTAFTLAPCLYYSISPQVSTEQQQRIWAVLMNAKINEFPVVCGSRKRFICQGILPLRTYCFMNCWEKKIGNKQTKFIQLRNLSQAVPQHSSDCFSKDLQSFIIDSSEFIPHIRPKFNSVFYSLSLKKSVPQFFQFQIKNGDELYLTLHQQKIKKGKLVILLGKIVQNQNIKYDFVNGKRQQIFSDVSLSLKDLQSGKYVVYVESTDESPSILRVYSSTTIILTSFSQQKHTFLQHYFYSNALKQNKTIKPTSLSKNPDDWYKAKMLFEQIGMSYLVINIGLTSMIKCEIYLNNTTLFDQGLKSVNITQKNYKNTIQKGNKQILIFQKMGQEFQTIQFPPNSVNVKIII